MALTAHASVDVIIAAYNAADTIGRAITSALAEPEVARVLVVDDASSDSTAHMAERADDGTGRLSVHRLPVNVGPSHARNAAIALGGAPFIAILDADDFLLAGRFERLFKTTDWDLIADNIAFVDEARLTEIDLAEIKAHRIAPRLLNTVDFVAGCISRSDRYKGELAFLKPVISRAFLDAHRLRYAEDMRLAEDFDLYVRALMHGARFRVAAGCHYVAVERATSLSASHGVVDLVRFEAAVERLLASAPADPTLRAVLETHRAQTARKRRHRAVLARKREVGGWRALREQAVTLDALTGVLLDIASDKFGAVRGAISPHRRGAGYDAIRYLL